MMNNKHLLGLSVIMFLVFGMAGTFWAAECPDERSRPNPLMDYVPQEIGVYDTLYSELEEPDCRGCHGASTSTIHHCLAGVADEDECPVPTWEYGCSDPCHPTIEDPPAVLIVRNCMSTNELISSGCHATHDNGWHHHTDLSANKQCYVCHDVMLDPNDPRFCVPEGPPGGGIVAAPYPYSCENCHWAQEVTEIGHPATFDHNGVQGVYKYGKPIYGFQDTHHMEFKSNFAKNCDWCHAETIIFDPYWAPDNDYLIRNCEKCHSIPHWVDHPEPESDCGTPLEFHALGGPGWEARGWHVEGLYYNGCTDLEPTVYTTWDEVCVGCHIVGQ